MHVTAEDIVLELVDEAGDAVAPGKSGEIVVTHLASRAFPFIRYRTGDFGVLAKEPCRLRARAARARADPRAQHRLRGGARTALSCTASR